MYGTEICLVKMMCHYSHVTCAHLQWLTWMLTRVMKVWMMLMRRMAAAQSMLSRLQWVTPDQSRVTALWRRLRLEEELRRCQADPWFVREYCPRCV